MILFLFFCSGATALVYEVVWSKYLSLMLGSTVQAQTVVLAVFMGGLALGNRLFGRRADAAANPLALYGKLEIAIGLYAFVFHLLHQAADNLFISAGTPLLDKPLALLALKAALSVGLLLGPTILMGGTLPLIAAWLNRRSADAGRLSARFYSVNSLGAVCGAWLAGFVLVQAMGMPASLQLTALMNIVLGLTALALARQPEPAASKSSETPPTPTTATSLGQLVQSGTTPHPACGHPLPSSEEGRGQGEGCPSSSIAPVFIGNWYQAISAWEMGASQFIASASPLISTRLQPGVGDRHTLQPLQRFPAPTKPLKRLRLRCRRATRLKPGANAISKSLAIN